MLKSRLSLNVLRHRRTRVQQVRTQRLTFVSLTSFTVVILIGWWLHGRYVAAMTYTAPIRWPAWWTAIRPIYGSALNAHDIAVVEDIALREKITPDRVILTLLYDPQTPNSGHWEGLDEDEVARFERIGGIQGHFSWHRSTAYKLRSGGQTPGFWGYLADGTDRKPCTIAQRVERVSNKIFTTHSVARSNRAAHK